MLSRNDMLGLLADKLGTTPPAPDAGGDYLFELSDDMRLGVRELPGGACVAWAGVSGPTGGEDADEAAAARFLRTRLARLRRHGGVVSTRGEDGGLLLYLPLRPETARELFEAVSELLNETEAVRRVMAGGGGRRTGEAELFSGMSALFGRR